MGTSQKLKGDFYMSTQPIYNECNILMERIEPIPMRKISLGFPTPLLDVDLVSIRILEVGWIANW